MNPNDEEYLPPYSPRDAELTQAMHDVYEALREDDVPYDSGIRFWVYTFIGVLVFFGVITAIALWIIT